MTDNCRIPVVTVVGAYGAPTIHEVCRNVRLAKEAAVMILKQSCAVYCPHHDLFLATSDPIDVEFLKAASMEFVRCSDAIYVVPGYENSQGTLAEIEEAKKFGIPVFYDMGRFTSWRSDWKDLNWIEYSREAII